MTIPAILHFVVPPQPSQRQSEIIAQARALNPNFEVRVWSDSDRNALGTLEPHFDKAKSGAQRGDIMRLAVVLRHGGIYLDADMDVRKELTPLLSLGAFLIASEDGQRLTNAFFAATPQHPALAAVRDDLLANEPDWSAPPNRTTGPELFTRVLHYRTDITVLPRESFYPYNYSEEPPATFKPTTFAVHEWEGSWLTAEQHARNAAIRAGGAGAPRPSLTTRVKDLGRRLMRALLPEHLRSEHRPNPVYDAGDHLVTRLETGPFIALNKVDMTVTPALATSGSIERQHEHFVASLIRGGDFIVDVGANVGIYSLSSAARCGPFGRVFSFEPNSSTAKLLRHGIMMNWVHDRLKVVELAASDAEGYVSFEGSDKLIGEVRVPNSTRGDFFELSGTVVGDRQTITIGATRLDAYFPVDLPFRLLKIDAEGHEVAVLRGARRLLESKCFDILMIEYGYESHHHDFAAFIAEMRLLETFGYRPHRLDWAGQPRSWPDYASECPSTGHENIFLFSPHAGVLTVA